jgi:hypothetical protein
MPIFTKRKMLKAHVNTTRIVSLDLIGGVNVPSLKQFAR